MAPPLFSGPQPGIMEVLSVAIFCFYVGHFFTRPLITQLILEVACHNEGLPAGECNSAAVSSAASLMALYSELALNIPSLAVSGVYGQLSDRHGRRVAMIAALSGNLTYYLVCGFVAYTQSPHYIALIVVASFVQGLLGANGTFSMAIFSYVSDITCRAEECRGGYFSVLEAATFGAKIVGPLVSGVWAERAGFVAPLAFASAIMAAGILWVTAVLPESCPGVLAERAAADAAMGEGKKGQLASVERPVHPPLDPLKVCQALIF